MKTFIQTLMGMVVLIAVGMLYLNMPVQSATAPANTKSATKTAMLPPICAGNPVSKRGNWRSKTYLSLKPIFRLPNVFCCCPVLEAA